MSAIQAACDGAQGTSQILYAVALYYLDQAIRLLEETVSSDELLARKSELSPGSSVGAHLRHIADHYRPLVDALEAAATGSPSSSSPSSPSATSSSPSASSRPPPPANSHSPLYLTYDRRQRKGEVETSVPAAIANFRQLKERFTRLTGAGTDVDPEREVRLGLVTPVEIEVKSSFARELFFASFHCVHHFALIRCASLFPVPYRRSSTLTLSVSQGHCLR
jgi:hypothetical protein